MSVSVIVNSDIKSAVKATPKAWVDAPLSKTIKRPVNKPKKCPHEESDSDILQQAKHICTVNVVESDPELVVDSVPSVDMAIDVHDSVPSIAVASDVRDLLQNYLSQTLQHTNYSNIQFNMQISLQLM